jgi:PST family polysaccharide transporter
MAQPERTIAPLGSQVASGFSLMLLQSVAGKAIAAVGQIILAWYLRPQEFGIVGLAFTISVLVGLLQQAGLREILIRRSRTFPRWANAAFWMSLATGFGAALLTAAIAPFAAAMYGADSPGTSRQQLIPILDILALAMPINAAATVPMVKLQIDLRFRALTAIALCQGTLNMALSCLLAANGFGPYSFVLPIPVSAAMVAIAAWHLDAPLIRRSPEFRKWRFMVLESSKLIVAGLFITACVQGGAFALGIFHYNDAVVGMYTFAFGISLQIAHLLTFNLGSVLFPALSRLGAEPQRQRAAFERAVRLLLLVGVSMCILQAAMADALLRFLFLDKWVGAILPLQILSVGMAFNLCNGPAINFLLTLGRTNTVLHLSMTSAAVYLVLVMVGASVGAAAGVAAAAAVHAFIFGHVYLVAAVRGAGGPASEVLPIFARPVGIALGGIVPIWALYSLMKWSDSRTEQFAYMAIGAPVAIGLTVALTKVFAPAEFNELWRHVRDRLPRRR